MASEKVRGCHNGTTSSIIILCLVGMVRRTHVIGKNNMFLFVTLHCENGNAINQCNFQYTSVPSYRRSSVVVHLYLLGNPKFISQGMPTFVQKNPNFAV